MSAGLLGFACDIGVRRNGGRVGAYAGPGAFREALASMGKSIPDHGDITPVLNSLEGAQERLAEAVAQQLDAVDRLLMVGGGHEATYGSHCGLRRHVGDQVVGVINIDAHFDLRDPYATGGNSGTAFSQIHADTPTGQWQYLVLGLAAESNSDALFDRASQIGAEWVSDVALQTGLSATVQDQIDQFVAASEVLHLSIDLDVLPRDQAPGVSAPAERGVPMPVVEALIDHIVDAARHCPGGLRLVDIVELNPTFDSKQMTARSAAVLASQVLGA
ncbi:formimidoylglutamase [Spiribacter salinus]|uniref:formimidoylglutamase n=1 Tax=Spiribacter salinus TaxID=1335746 RepID=UPI001C9807A6|nr:formimidoylglutamase [Spiribacter salinus]MBY5269251.1 formimidoylglutamase [Spiribacter salinus]